MHSFIHPGTLLKLRLGVVVLLPADPDLVDELVIWLAVVFTGSDPNANFGLRVSLGFAARPHAFCQSSRAPNRDGAHECRLQALSLCRIFCNLAPPPMAKYAISVCMRRGQSSRRSPSSVEVSRRKQPHTRSKRLHGATGRRRATIVPLGQNWTAIKRKHA